MNTTTSKGLPQATGLSSTFAEPFSVATPPRNSSACASPKPRISRALYRAERRRAAAAAAAWADRFTAFALTMAVVGVLVGGAVLHRHHQLGTEVPQAEVW